MARAIELANLIHAPQALRREGAHDVEIAVHDIDPSLGGQIPRMDEEYRVLTIVDVEREEVLAAGFITLAEAAEVIEVIVMTLRPHSNVCLWFCQGAVPTPALEQYLGSASCPYGVGRSAGKRYWQRDGVARGSGEAAVLAATTGQANRISVDRARQVVAAAVVTNSLLQPGPPPRERRGSSHE